MSIVGLTAVGAIIGAFIGKKYVSDLRELSNKTLHRDEERIKKILKEQKGE